MGEASLILSEKDKRSVEHVLALFRHIIFLNIDIPHRDRENSYRNALRSVPKRVIADLIFVIF